MSIGGLFVYPMPNSPNEHHKNWMGDSKENYYWDLGNEKVNQYTNSHVREWNFELTNLYRKKSLV